MPYDFDGDSRNVNLVRSDHESSLFDLHRFVHNWNGNT